MSRACNVWIGILLGVIGVASLSGAARSHGGGTTTPDTPSRFLGAPPEGGAGAPKAKIPNSPNVVVILADDLGWGDVGYHNPLVVTPNLDQLATEGAKLERYYTAPICSPARMSMLTGRYPIRWGMQRRINENHVLRGLPRNQDTMPELFHREGYGYCSAMGKWHVGNEYSRNHPIHAGFDAWYGSISGGGDYFTHERLGERDWRLDFADRPQDDGIYQTDLIADHAVAEIQAHAGDVDPFLLFVGLHAPHTPNQAPQSWINYYCANAGLDCSDPVEFERARHWALVTSMDEALGKVLDALDQEGIADETIVWFISDNGGQLPGGADNSPLRGGKGMVYEGGIRVPSVVRWPGFVPPGLTVDSMVTVVDVLPTLHGMVGSIVPNASQPLRPFDGKDVYFEILGLNGSDRSFYTYLSRDNGVDALAIVTTEAKKVRWKATWNGDNFGPNWAANTVPAELFDLDADPGETTDLKGQEPQVLNALLTELWAWRSLRFSEGVGYPDPLPDEPPGWAPTPNWEFRDQPFTAEGALLGTWQLTTGGLDNEVGRFGSPSGPMSIGTSSDGPEGVTDLSFGGVAFRSRDHLLHGVNTSGTELYQIDGLGQILFLGPIVNPPVGAQITAAGWDVVHDVMVMWDENSSTMYVVEPGNLTATPVPLIGVTPGSVRILDFAPLPQGGFWAWDNPGNRFLQIEVDGNTTASTPLGSLGEFDGLWTMPRNTVLGYRSKLGGNLEPTGMYLIHIPTGQWQLLSAGPPLDRVDGAGAPVD